MKRKQWSHILNTKFATELIKRIPSNLFCAHILGVPATNIATKRKSIPGAVKAGHYHLTDQTKQRFKSIVSELKKDDKLFVSPINNVSITVTLDEKTVTLYQGDVLKVMDGKLFILREL